MRIAVLAHQLLIPEIENKKRSGHIEFVYSKNLEEFLQEPKVDAYFDFDFQNEKERVEQLSTLLPKPVFINAVLDTLCTMGANFIRINAWPGFLERSCCELAWREGIQEEERGPGSFIMKALGWDYQMVPDIAGMLSPRIVSMIINEAYFALEDQVSNKNEIDIAMKLGTHYPYGPFEWSEKIGIHRVFALLEVLSKEEERYRAAGSMKRECEAHP